MSSSLAARIASVAALTVCRYCGSAVPAEAVLCACRIAAGERPHTEWGRELKQFLLIRAIEKQRPRTMSEQYLWEKLLLDGMRYETVGEGATRRQLPHALTVVQAYPHALTAAAAWVAAGSPKSFTV